MQVFVSLQIEKAPSGSNERMKAFRLGGPGRGEGFAARQDSLASDWKCYDSLKWLAVRVGERERGACRNDKSVASGHIYDLIGYCGLNTARDCYEYLFSIDGVRLARRAGRDDEVPDTGLTSASGRRSESSTYDPGQFKLRSESGLDVRHVLIIKVSLVDLGY